MKLLPWAAALLALAGCGGDGATHAPTETVAARPWQESVDVEGVITAVASTPLPVPGAGFEMRELLSMAEEGSLVRKGDVIARFDAPQSRMELSQAEFDLLRKALEEQTLADTAGVNRAELLASIAKVDSDMELSKRYADIKVEAGVLTRNQILDALQDSGFLKNKRGYLTWKTGQAAARTAADLAVITAQKDSVGVRAEQRRRSLDALELLAPHDGVFLLNAKWDGSKPQVGASMWAGTDFGRLPDPSRLTVTFSVAEGLAFGLKPGLPVHARLAGTGTGFDLKITKVGTSASSKSRESPVKYTEVEAAIDPALAARIGLAPGQAVRASVRVVDRPSAVTVPNLALVREGATYAVFTGTAAPGTRQAVQIGQRGMVRTEIRSGLAAGTKVLLLPGGARAGSDGNEQNKDRSKDLGKT
jgi:multidrug efflux pump subunit AcrA (membrane-fusion protein)